VGVIAEEVGAVVPEVVTWEKDGKDAQSVDYGRLTALLIEATKEQQRQFEQQEVVLRTQAVAIRNLKSELRAMRQWWGTRPLVVEEAADVAGQGLQWEGFLQDGGSVMDQLATPGSMVRISRHQ
jgi:hypothetical protein